MKATGEQPCKNSGALGVSFLMRDQADEFIASYVKEMRRLDMKASIDAKPLHSYFCVGCGRWHAL